MELYWTKNKPTTPGAYWVRGYEVGRSHRKALVVVMERGGELCSNLHSTNSDNDDEPTPLANHSDRFEWCGPLVPANARHKPRGEATSA